MHFENGESEIDDRRFFLAEDGYQNTSAELNATIDALLHETKFDDNATACRFPARKDWLVQKLNITDLPNVECKEFDLVMQKLQPSSTTLVFPAAHINSPASMFGHTFLRINSKYNSQLLSYAVNYAADADPSKENGFVFAIKGLFGGYFGKYSLLPYYDKLKEYRDGEQRDVWEYDLNLSEEETIRMLKHIWELNNTHSYYYFFTQNCSYNMLWFLEAAREELKLREYFTYQVIPLETVHAANLEKIVIGKSYRPSKRTTLLKYEELIDKQYIDLVQKLINEPNSVRVFLNNTTISQQQKRYILEAALELLEYQYKKNTMSKDIYLNNFHILSSSRALLGQGKTLSFDTPPNPIDGHRAIRLRSGFGFREGDAIGFLGIRPSYHDIDDISAGYLRGTQIEFFNLELSYSNDDLEVEQATLFSLVSLSQRSEFFKTFSWRAKFGVDRDHISNNSTHFLTSVGAGFSWGNDLGYIYFLLDPLAYIGRESTLGIGASGGFVIDKFTWLKSNIELTHRIYDNKEDQQLIKATQNIAIGQNSSFQLVYDYKKRKNENLSFHEETFKAFLNFYF